MTGTVQPLLNSSVEAKSRPEERLVEASTISMLEAITPLEIPFGRIQDHQPVVNEVDWNSISLSSAFDSSDEFDDNFSNDFILLEKDKNKIYAQEKMIYDQIEDLSPTEYQDRLSLVKLEDDDFKMHVNTFETGECPEKTQEFSDFSTSARPASLLGSEKAVLLNVSLVRFESKLDKSSMEPAAFSAAHKREQDVWKLHGDYDRLLVVYQNYLNKKNTVFEYIQLCPEYRSYVAPIKSSGDVYQSLRSQYQKLQLDWLRSVLDNSVNNEQDQLEFFASRLKRLQGEIEQIEADENKQVFDIKSEDQSENKFLESLNDKISALSHDIEKSTLKPDNAVFKSSYLNNTILPPAVFSIPGGGGSCLMKKNASLKEMKETRSKFEKCIFSQKNCDLALNTVLTVAAQVQSSIDSLRSSKQSELKMNDN